jgi:phosphomannomutase/phosphoglucomutase
MTAAVMVSILAEEREKLSEIVSSLPRRSIVKGKIPAADADAVINGLTGRFSKDNIDRLDGLKIIRGSSWALIRKSGTEPLMRITVESEDNEQAEVFYKEVTSAIQDLLNNTYNGSVEILF